jgi:hypothetical protein
MPSWIVDPQTGELVDKEEYYFKKYSEKAHLQMMNGNTPVTMNFISDSMEPTRHMADGKYYTSKAAFRAATKAAGCIEIGNETKHLLKKRPQIKLDKRKRREDIKKAINDLKYGNVPKHPT